jgi:predicted 2-oxoglutarate/Fe(II)-dependent dioxygenase YbiX
MIEEIKLSDSSCIYRTRFEGNLTKAELLEVYLLNEKYSTRSDSNSIWVEIESRCLDLINEFVKSEIESIEKRKFNTYAKHTWFYTQKKRFNLEWMHRHLLVHPDNRTTITSDYTFTYYVQVPKDVKGKEGHIVFEDTNKNQVSFFPNEGDIFIFKGDALHTAIPTPNSDTKRIVYAGSFCIDVTNQKKYNVGLI